MRYLIIGPLFILAVCLPYTYDAGGNPVPYRGSPSVTPAGLKLWHSHSYRREVGGNAASGNMHYSGGAGEWEHGTSWGPLKKGPRTASTIKLTASGPKKL